MSMQSEETAHFGPEPTGSRWWTSEEKSRDRPHKERIFLGSAAVRLRPLSLRRRCERADERHTYSSWSLADAALGFIVSKQWTQAKLLLLLRCFI